MDYLQRRPHHRAQPRRRKRWLAQSPV